MNCGSLVNATSLRHSQCVLQLAARAAAASVRPSLTQVDRQLTSSRPLQQACSTHSYAQSIRQHHACAVAAAEPATAAVAQEVSIAEPEQALCVLVG